MKNTFLLNRGYILIVFYFLGGSFFFQSLKGQCSLDNTSVYASGQVFIPDESCEGSDPYFRIKIELFNNNSASDCRNKEILLEDIVIIIPDNTNRLTYPIRDQTVHDISNGLPGVPFSQGVWENTKTVVSAGYFASAALRKLQQNETAFEVQIEGRIVDTNGSMSSEPFSLTYDMSSISYVNTSNCEGASENSGNKLSSDNKHALSQIDLYPNPAKQHALLSFEASEDSQVEIEILNSYGQTIRTLARMNTLMKGKHQVKIEVSDLAAGMYYARIRTGSVAQVIKWIKIN